MRINGTNLSITNSYQTVSSKNFYIIEKIPCPVGMDAGDMSVHYYHGILHHKKEDFFVKYKIRHGLLHKFNFVVYTRKGQDIVSPKKHAELLLKNMEKQAKHFDSDSRYKLKRINLFNRKMFEKYGLQL